MCLKMSKKKTKSRAKPQDINPAWGLSSSQLRWANSSILPQNTGSWRKTRTRRWITKWSRNWRTWFLNFSQCWESLKSNKSPIWSTWLSNWSFLRSCSSSRHSWRRMISYSTSTTTWRSIRRRLSSSFWIPSPTPTKWPPCSTFWGYSFLSSP